ncbi:YhdP family protein [Kiloniella sp. b19]|uniref:YhdP family protein n=1 Tax=Kiloniella sp. GXU_MW_B19 TaxID=3141326 RepID=UPI0031E0B177
MTRISLEILAGLLMVAAVTIGVLVWRLSAGPVYLDFVTPYLEKALVNRERGLHLDVGNTLLAWVAEDRSIALRVEDARILNKQGDVVAAVPLMGIELDVPLALRGQIVPTVIQIIGPQLSIVRLENGNFVIEELLPSGAGNGEGQVSAADLAEAVGAELPEAEEELEIASGDPSPNEAETTETGNGEQASTDDGGAKRESAVLGAMMALLEERSPDNPLSYLNEISIRSATIKFDDREQGITFFAPRADISVRRDTLGLAGDLRFAVDLSDDEVTSGGAAAETGKKETAFEPVLVEGAFVFDRSLDVIDLALESRGLRPARLARLMPASVNLEQFDLPLSLSLVSSLNLDGEIGRTRFEISGGEGSLGIQELDVAPLPVSALLLKGSYAPESERLVLDNFAINFGTFSKPGPKLAVAGNISDWSGQTNVLLGARVLEMPVNDLELYWPAALGDNAREWVTRNIRSGMAKEASIKLVLKAGETGTGQNADAPSETETEANPESPDNAGKTESEPKEQPVPEGGLARLVHALETQVLEISSLEGAIEYEGLDVHYFRPLPPVRNVAGSAVVHEKGLTLFADGGTLLDMKVHPSTIDIKGLDIGQESIDIQTSLEGPVPTALKVLDQKPLGLISKLGLKPDQTGGKALVAVDFSFPLLQDLLLEDIKVMASADLTNAAFENIFREHNATDGTLKLDVTQDGMVVTGPVLLEGHPMDIQWNESFVDLPTDQPTTTLKVGIPKIDSADLKTLVELETAPWVEGPLSANLLYEQFPGGIGQASVAANLKEAHLGIAPLAWQKEQGVPATVQASLRFDDGELKSIDKAVVSADDLNAEGQLVLENDAIRSAFFDRLALGTTELEAVGVVFEPFENGQELRPVITIGGGVLDARPFIGDEKDQLKELEQELDGASQTTQSPVVAERDEATVPLTENSAPPEAVDDEPTPPFVLQAAALDRVILGEERWLENVSLDFDNTAEGWKRLGVKALIPETFRSRSTGAVQNTTVVKNPDKDDVVAEQRQKQKEEEAARKAEELENAPPPGIVLRYQPDEQGVQRLSLETRDLGGFLRSVDVLDSVQGGTLRVHGQAQSWHRDIPLTGRLEGESLRFVDAPILAKLLSFASLTGPLNALSGEGVLFENLEGDFTLKNGVFVSEDLRLYSSGLGLTGKGWIDSNSSHLDMVGTIVPAYTLNRFLGGIPILGQILTGGDGGGIVAFNYSVRGSTSDPDVSINPLSGLTPGFLRRILPKGAEDVPEQGVVTEDEEEQSEALQ